MEIGGFLEIPYYNGSILHDNAIALNSARNSLAYIIEAKKIKKIALPRFLCSSVEQVCRKYNIIVRYYAIGIDFLPTDLDFASDDEWLYLVNYYGQISNEKIAEIQKLHSKLIVDNVQAYFQKPVQNIDTIYTCRKYFGVPDGAFLYTDSIIDRELQQDKSMERMTHLLGRFEDTAHAYYMDYMENEKIFESLPLRRMSKLTNNILRSLDYEKTRLVRERNFLYLHNAFKPFNSLMIHIPIGPFMYPLYLNGGAQIRSNLQNRGIYIPTIWPDVLEICDQTDLEYNMAKDILPIPVDQRYTTEDLDIVISSITSEMETM